MPEKKTKNDKSADQIALARKAETQCEYVMPANGRRCTTARLHGSARCWKHPPDKFKQTLVPPPDAESFDNRRIKTLEQIVETQEWIFNQVYLGLIANEKGRILTDMLKAQVTYLNEIYKRTPEGQDRTLDQIGKMIAMARIMTEEDASRILLSKDFGQSLTVQVEGEVLLLEGEKNAEQVDAVLEGDIPDGDDGPATGAPPGDTPAGSS